MKETVNKTEGGKRGKWVGICLIILICLTVGVNYFTGFLKGEWLPINPEEDFDGDEVSNLFDSFPYEVDGDGDGFLDGYSIQTTAGSVVYRSFSELGIIYYTDQAGNVTFFGEEDVGGNPTQADSELVEDFTEHIQFVDSLPEEDQGYLIEKGLLSQVNLDADSDGFWHGYNLQTPVGSPIYQHLNKQDTICYEDPDGNATFFGEEDVGGNLTYADNGLAFRVRQHIDYILGLSLEKQRDMMKKGELMNRDLDGDFMDTAFEVNIAGLDPYVKNDRYFIYINSNTGSSDVHLVPFEPIDSYGSSKDEYRYILKENRFQPENVLTLLATNATKENFEEMISDLSSKVTEKDIVYVQISGHANIGVYAFNDGMGGDGGEKYGGGTVVEYGEIDKLLDKINAKMLVIAPAGCGSHVPESTNPLKEGPCPRVVIGGWNLLSYTNTAFGGWADKLQRYASQMDKGPTNGFISIGEHYNFFLCNPSLGVTKIALVDPYNIASKLYFGDANLEGMKEVE